MVNKGNGQIKVAIYSRVSTQEQATEGTSLDFQQSQMELFCQIQGFQITQIYSDPGYTGKDDQRPGLKRMRSDAAFGLFNRVLVYKLDRLSRKLRLLLELQDEFKEHEVYLCSAKENIDTSTAIGKTVFQVLGLVAEWERDAIIERTKSGRLQRYKEGKWSAGYPVFGYKYNRVSKKLDIDKPKAMIVERIFKQYVSGNSFASIANQLNSDGIKPRDEDATGWRSSAISNIIVNPVYKGSLIVNRHKHIANIATADPTQTITIKVPPIVEESLWETAQNQRKKNRHFREKRTNEWLLQGVIICGICGHAFRAEFNHSQRRMYSCRGRLSYTHLDGSPRCIAPRQDADWLENEVWSRIKAIINDPNKLQSLIQDTISTLKSREAELNTRIKPINSRLAQLSEQKTRLADEWVIMNMTPEKYDHLKQSILQEEARLQSIRSEVDPAQIEELEQTQNMLNYWESQIKTMTWNTENEDRSMVRIVDKPHEAIFRLLGSDNESLSKEVGFPTTQRELMRKLRVQVMVFEDRINIKSIFPMEPIGKQMCTSTYRSARFPQSQ
jgi:site-specific DNA recombinase